MSVELSVCVGLPLLYNDYAFNTVCFISNGAIRGFVAKQHLANDLIYYETRWFKRWQSGVRSSISFDGNTYPIGDLVFSIDSYRIGFEICEDAWVANRPAITHGGQGVNVILNPDGLEAKRLRGGSESIGEFGTRGLESGWVGIAGCVRAAKTPFDFLASLGSGMFWLRSTQTSLSRYAGG